MFFFRLILCIHYSPLHGCEFVVSEKLVVISEELKELLRIIASLERSRRIHKALRSLLLQTKLPSTSGGDLGQDTRGSGFTS